MLPRVLTTVGARQHGWSAERVETELAHGRWRVMVRGIYLTRPDPPERADWIRAGLALGGRGGVLSGWDATRAHLLGDPRPATPEILILTRDGENRRRGRVHLRRSDRPLAPAYRSVDGVGGLMVAPAARAVADTALSYRTFSPVRALVTSAVQAGRCTCDQLEAELEAGPRNGSAHLRRAIADAVRGAASIAEAELADLLTDPTIAPFELNVEVYDRFGRLLGVADVLWRTLRAVLEVDSRAHHSPEQPGEKWLRTMARHNRLERYQLSALHYAPVQFRADPARVREEVAAWLRGRARDLGVAYPPPAPLEPNPPFIVPSPL